MLQTDHSFGESNLQKYSKIFLGVLSVACVFMLAPLSADAQSPRNLSGASTELRKLELLINGLAKEHIPHKYEKKKGWGNQKERWDGLHIQLKDFELKTKRRKKLVNHGTWKMYSAELADPQRLLSFQLNSIKKSASGKAVVNMSVTADLNLFGRLSEWVKGVQLFSFSVEGKANVTLNVVATIGTRLDFKNLPPDLYLEPVIDRAKLTVNDFRIKRVSKVGGEFAQQLGRGVRQILNGKIEEYQTKLVDKMNKSIAKKKGKLKLSIADLVDSEWSKFEEYLGPEDTIPKKNQSRQADKIDSQSNTQPTETDRAKTNDQPLNNPK